MGNSRSALKMIMEELQDVDKAIEFAKEQDDGELWEDLILYSIDKPRKWASFWEALHVYFFVEVIAVKYWILCVHVREGAYGGPGRCSGLWSATELSHCA